MLSNPTYFVLTGVVLCFCFTSVEILKIYRINVGRIFKGHLKGNKKQLQQNPHFTYKCKLAMLHADRRYNLPQKPMHT